MLGFCNKKCKNLNAPQKKLLKEFINNISNTNSLSDFILNEIKKVKKQLKSLLPSIKDKVAKIKVTEAMNQMESIVHTKRIKDKNVLSLMRYYELVKELKLVKGK